MTDDEILNLAKKYGYWSGHTIEMNDVGLFDFAHALIENEREACAKACEEVGFKIHGGRDDSEAYDCADAIRTRNNQ